MTAESFADTAPDEDGSLRCYRHPDRVTYVRCGRCDRPICARCAMQGPVGFRCRTCGKPAYDPLTSFTVRQLALGTAVSLGAGTVGGFIGLQLGFFVIFVGFFAGGLIADAVMRVTGFKRGPLMAVILLGGIAVGTLFGAVLDYSLTAASFNASTQGVEYGYSLLSYLVDSFAWGAIYAGAAMVGAWGRLRF
jgi:hypothetical protein